MGFLAPLLGGGGGGAAAGTAAGTTAATTVGAGAAGTAGAGAGATLTGATTPAFMSGMSLGTAPASNAIASGLKLGGDMGAITAAPKMGALDGAINYATTGKFNPTGDTNFFQNTIGDNRIAKLLDKSDKMGLLNSNGVGRSAQSPPGLPMSAPPSLYRRRKQGG